MKQLIIYDNEGYVISQATGDVRTPVGVPYMLVEVPTKKYIERIDVIDPLNHVPVFADIAKSEVDTLNEKVELMQAALDELLLGGAL